MAAMYKVRSADPGFQEFFSRTSHAMYVYDATSLRFLAVNPSALAKYGYTLEEFLGMTIMDIRSTTEQARLKESLSRRATPVCSPGSWRHLRKNGSEIIMDVTAYDLTFDSHDARIVVAIDVTEQEVAAERTRRYVAELETALMSSINVLSAVAELRDPYTAGHQQHVSRLAAAIASEMKLDEDMQTGIAVMGLVHDIGKIGIPVDILSKPRSLTPVEYELVKTHAHLGNEVLAKLNFKWPVAECVLQHHERLDGSGYPRALTAPHIRLEARILAVADVMESVSGHRPYHPGLGDAKALEEVVMGSGVLYDPDVVDACVRLFRGGYSIH